MVLAHAYPTFNLTESTQGEKKWRDMFSS